VDLLLSVWFHAEEVTNVEADKEESGGTVRSKHTEDSSATVLDNTACAVVILRVNPS
jgi:hypothetical protein